MTINRRQMFAGAGMALLAALGTPAMAAEQPKWPALTDFPADFNPERLFVELQAKGKGVEFGKKDAPVTVFICFDTQCRWCRWEFEQLEPFLDRVRFVWYPVAVLNPWSELQGAAILASADPQKTFREHEEHFLDADFKGLDVRKMEVPFDMREQVWVNSKEFRRAGGRSVPGGVMKTADGKYVPVPEIKTADFAKLAGL